MMSNTRRVAIKPFEIEDAPEFGPERGQHTAVEEVK